jgi:putative transposase
MYYQKKMPTKDQIIKAIILSVIGNGRMGRDKVIARVQRLHPHLSASKIRRVYTREGLSLPLRMRKARVKRPANPIEISLSKNQEWAIDFMSDSLTNGRRFRTLNVVDHYNRACLGIEIAHSLPAKKVTAFLDIMIEIHGVPKKIRTDNGPEFISKAFGVWLNKKGIKWNPIEAGKPQQNAIVERFNRTYREDVLDRYLFDNLEHAKEITENWLQDYNQLRPHQALGNLTPEEYAA